MVLVNKGTTSVVDGATLIKLDSSFTAANSTRRIGALKTARYTNWISCFDSSVACPAVCAGHHISGHCLTIDCNRCLLIGPIGSGCEPYTSVSGEITGDC